MSAATKTLAARKPAPWGSRPLVALLGGPRSRWWYFRTDAELLAQQEKAAGRSWSYVETAERVEHPTYEATGAVWRWKPLTAARRR